jgi:hypothetical protein
MGRLGFGVTKRLYPQDRKRGRALQVPKEVTGQPTEKQKGSAEKCREYSTVPTSAPTGSFHSTGSQSYYHKVSQETLVTTDWQTWLQDNSTIVSSLKSSGGFGMTVTSPARQAGRPALENSLHFTQSAIARWILSGF